jgi:hypothetical protein
MPPCAQTCAFLIFRVSFVAHLMNAAQLRRLEEKLNEAEEFFLDGSMLNPTMLKVRDDLREMLRKVVAERIRAEPKDSRHPFSKRAAL